MGNSDEKRRATLLIVEDEEDIREVLLMAFEREDWAVYGASNGQEALEIMEQYRVDAVMSDIKMPVMDGLKLLTVVRERGMDTPFLFLTANGDKQSAISALRLGAMDFIEKPFQLEELRKQVKKAVERGYALRVAEAAVVEEAHENTDSPQFQQLKKAKKALWLAKKQRTG